MEKIRPKDPWIRGGGEVVLSFSHEVETRSRHKNNVIPMRGGAWGPVLHISTSHEAHGLGDRRDKVYLYMVDVP